MQIPFQLLFFRPAGFFDFCFWLTFQFSMLNHLKQFDTQLTKSIIQLNLKQYRLIAVACEVMAKRRLPFATTKKYKQQFCRDYFQPPGVSFHFLNVVASLKTFISKYNGQCHQIYIYISYVEFTSGCLAHNPDTNFYLITK